MATKNLSSIKGIGQTNQYVRITKMDNKIARTALVQSA